MTSQQIPLHVSVLNSADAGLSLAAQVLDALKTNGSVELDFSQVQRMTPSFANAFTMTLLAEMTLDQLRSSVALLNRNDLVTNAITESVRRYQRGVRLSTQQTAAI